MAPTFCGSCGSVLATERAACPHCGASAGLSKAPSATAAALLLGLFVVPGMSGCGNQALYGVVVVDADEDGFFEGEDCDDDDPDVNPDAEEVAGDGVDSNCDGDDDT